MGDWPSSGTGSAIVVAAFDAPLKQKRAADYVCDGVADEVEINAAIATLPTITDSQLTIPGGKVRLTSGNFSINGEILFQRDRSTFEGAGRGATFITRGSGFASATGTQMFRFDRMDMATQINRRPCLWVTVRGFTINGMYHGTGGTYDSIAGKQGEMDGIHFRAARSILDEVEVYGCNNKGIRVHGIEAADNGASGWSAYGVELSRCKVYENGTGGIIYDVYSADSGLVNCEIFENAGPGLFLSDVTNWVTNCYLWGNRDNGPDPVTYPGNGLRTNVFTNRSIITGNKIEQNRHGVELTSGSEINFIGNFISSNSYAKTGNADGANGEGVDASHWFAGESSTVATQGALSGTATGTFTVTSAAVYPPAGVGQFRVQIDNERMLVTISGTTVTIVTRGVDGTTAATHAVGANVYVGRPIALGQCDDIFVNGSAGAPTAVYFTGNIINGNVYTGDQSRYGINIQSGDQLVFRQNKWDGAWATARQNIAGGASGHFDFEALPVYFDGGNTGAATITPDPFNGELQIYTLTGNITMAAPSFARTGMKLRFRLAQDATGGRTIAWNAIYSLGAWVHKLGASQVSEISFVYDGTNWVAADDSPPVLTASFTYDPASLTTGTAEVSTRTVPGARIGDIVLCSHTTIPAPTATAWWQLIGVVTANDTVVVRLQNNTGGTVNLASGTLQVLVFKR